VTLLAIGRLLLPYERKPGFAVIEGNCLQIYFPAIGFMAIVAISFKAIAMR
jgi:hypothetical protein